MDSPKTPLLYTSNGYKNIKNRQVAIVGAGISSLTLASKLIQRDPECSVVIFCDKNEVATGGSSNEQGAIYPLLQATESTIAKFYASAYQYACEFYRDTLPSDDVVQHQWCGVLQQAINDAQHNKFPKIASLWPELTELHNAEQSSDISGLTLPFSSLYYSEGGWLNPKQYCHWLAKKLSDAGVSILFQHSVISLAKTHNTKPHSDAEAQSDNDLLENHKWQVIYRPSSSAVGKKPCPDSELTYPVHFDQIVIAAGIDTVNIQESGDLPVEPVLGQVSKMSAGSSLSPLKTVLCHKGYITPGNGQFQSFGATFEKAQTHSEVKESANIANIVQIQKVYPEEAWAKALQITDIASANAAFRATTSDHLPLVGELVDWDWIANYVDKNTGDYRRKDKIKDTVVNKYAGLYVLTGLGARGLTSAPILAELLAKQLTQGLQQSDHFIAETVAPIRFKLREYKRNKRIPS